MFRAAVVVAILGSAAIAVSGAGAGSGRTVVHYFHGYRAGKLAPQVRVTRVADGYCWEESAVESRRYAWRCFTGNVILDPCFSATRHGRFVICPVEPWSHDVVRLRLTRTLPAWRHYPYKRSLPVGVWTTTGKRRSHSSGATSEIEKEPITYECAGGGVLAGFAHRSSRIWTISYGKSFKARSLTRVGIADAWW